MTLLQDYFNGKDGNDYFTFINRGFSGYSSKHAVKYVLPELDKSLRNFDDSLGELDWTSKTCSSQDNQNVCSNPNPNQNLPKNLIKFATIFYGANDSVLKSCQDNKQHVPIQTFKNNLKKFINHFNQPNIYKNLQKIVLITLPKYDYENWKVVTKEKYNLEEFPESKRSNENSRLYRDAVFEIKEEYEKIEKTENSENLKFTLEIADMFTALENVDNFESYLVDGLHFNEKGNYLLFELLKSHF